MRMRTPLLTAAIVMALVLPAGPGLAATGTAAPDSTGTRTPQPRVVATVATGLTSPWGLAFLPDGSALVSERDTAVIRRIPEKGGQARAVGTVHGVTPFGEGGLLGIAVPPGADPAFLFAYITTARDNRVIRIAWDGAHLGRQTAILTGIPRSDHHDGGRLLIGPDDTLFVGTGDAGVPARAQDRRSLAGKVLRISFDGTPAPGNPFPHSPVYTLGHRNVQGLALDQAGRLWASEFGEHDVDELNLLRPGRNYGWPVHEGAAKDRRYVNPAAQWSPTSLASPSGIAILGGVVYVASLRGERLWQVPLAGARAGTPVAARLGDLGRLRNVTAAPDGSLWLMTSNTDGRGQPRRLDDRIVRLAVASR